MTRDKVALGRLGEEIVRLYYQDRGWEVLAERWRVREGELDLVVRRRGTVAFVEVKTRRGARCGTPAEAVDRRKLSRMRRVARRWLVESRPAAARYRFDVAALMLRPDGSGLELDVLTGVG